MSRLKITKQVEICKIFKQMVYSLKKLEDDEEIIEREVLIWHVFMIPLS